MKRKQKIISLGVLAKQQNMTKSRLEYYNALGFIKPLFQMTNGVRGYDEIATIRKIKLIKKYREEGLSLQKIEKELKKNK